MEQPKLTAYERRRIETLSNHILFDELIELASEICFGRQIEFKSFQTSLHPEAEIVAQLGIRGLRTALDISSPGTGYEGDAFDGERAPEEFDPGEEYIWIDSPLREVKTFGDQPNLEIINKAKQFGEVLLSDAYKVLGQDVFDKVREFRAAETDEEQIRVINWLDDRLYHLTRSDEGLIESETNDHTDKFLYHPLRLSPKAMGVYPRHKLAPTCLGVSIITASFLEQAGVDHMHTGVMISARQHRLLALANLLRDTKESLSELGSDVSEIVTDVLQERAEQVVGNFYNDEGYHAANIFRMKSGRWCQIDTNYESTTTIEIEVHNERLDQAYKDIFVDFKDIAPGLERSVPMGVSNMSALFNRMLDTIDLENINEDKIKDILLNEDEAIPEKIKQLFTDDVFIKRITQSEASESESVTLEVLKVYKHDAFHKLFIKYVLWNEDIDKVQDMCRKDSVYLERRINDIKNLVFPMVASVALEFDKLVNGVNGEYPAHNAIEVGEPAHRIGMAVLSDVAVYCDDRLPPSFWLANWSSHVPLTETIPEDISTIRSSEEALLRNNTLVHEENNLSYAKSRGIIYKFLAQLKEKEKEDGSD
jgi:hypothetical protein